MSLPVWGQSPIKTDMGTAGDKGGMGTVPQSIVPQSICESDLQQVVAMGDVDCFGPVGGTELLEDDSHVGLDHVL